MTDADRERADVRLAPEAEGGRIETGPTQFGDDWPGIFIRGDNAMHYARIIRRYLAGGTDPLTEAALSGLARLLASCDTRAHLKEDRP